MDVESDSDEFFDAVDGCTGTPGRKSNTLTRNTVVPSSASQFIQVVISKPGDNEVPLLSSAKIDILEGPPKPPRDETSTLTKDNVKVLELEQRRRKLDEMRMRVQNEDDEHSSIVFSDSRNPSVSDVYVHPSSHGRAAQTPDAQSVFSLGKVGRLLNESERFSICGSLDRRCVMVETDRLSTSSGVDSRFDTVSISSSNFSDMSLPTLQEPDLVASTKSGDKVSSGGLLAPQAPPRRKKKRPPALPTLSSFPPLSGTSSIEASCSVDRGEPSCSRIPSPGSTVECLTKNLDFALDLKSATKGQYVVKPQDDEASKVVNPGTPFGIPFRCGEGEKDALSTPESVDSDKAELEREDRDKFPSQQSLSEVNQLNMNVRLRTDSGKRLTDDEILGQVMVVNLDTQEQVPLSLAEDRLPRCVNPISLHLMRLTAEYVSNSSIDQGEQSDAGEELAVEVEERKQPEATAVKRKAVRIRNMIKGRIEKTVHKIKSEIHNKQHAGLMAEDAVESSEDEPLADGKQFKFKASSAHKGPYEFDNVKIAQDIKEHVGAIWTMKFSYCGRLLATAGQDHTLKIWVIKDAFDYFNDMRQKYSTQESKVSPTPSTESLVSQHFGDERKDAGTPNEDDDFRLPFMSRPFCSYTGHTADVLDVSWSKNLFLLSSSMDKTVRLWHISRRECLCCFQHIDFVTAIAFHPRDDRYFISGSLDGKLRLWNIPDKKVALWSALDGQTKLITSASFCQNGKFAVVGSYDGRCIFYNTEQLKYYTRIDVRSSRGKNAKGRKISGIEPMLKEDKILVTSNDSRIRLYDLRDLSLSCKYKGYVNTSSQIRASFSHDGKYVISGSENQFIYLWKTQHDYSKFSSARRDRNDYWESIKAHNAVVTSAVFAPNPAIIIRQIEKAEQAMGIKAQTAEDAPSASGGAAGLSASGGRERSASFSRSQHYIFVTADFNGVMKVFVNKAKSQSLKI